MRTGRASRGPADHLSSARGEITSLTRKEKEREGRNLSNDKGEDSSESFSKVRLETNISMIKYIWPELQN